MSLSPESCIHRPRPRRPSTSKTKVNPIDPFTCSTKARKSGAETKRSDGGFPDPWDCCCCLLYMLLLALGILLGLSFLSYVFPTLTSGQWVQRMFGLSPCPTSSASSSSGAFSGSGSEKVGGNQGQGQGQCQGEGHSEESCGGYSTSSANYAVCESGAHIFRVNNWPPFRGEECDRGTHLILEPGPLDANKFWQFNPVGDVEISLSAPILVSGFTLKHPQNADLDTRPNKIEFNGIDYNEHYSDKTTHHFGDFSFTDKQKDQQTFQVANPSSQKFQIVQLRFHNSQTNTKIIHVYKVEIHGTP